MNIELFPLWIVLAIITIPFLVLLIWCWTLRDRKPVAPLIIRLKDRAIFMRAITGSLGSPTLYRRLVWVKRSWRRGGMLVPTDETWSCNDPSLYDVVAREYVVEGCKQLEAK